MTHTTASSFWMVLHYRRSYQERLRSRNQNVKPPRWTGFSTHVLRHDVLVSDPCLDGFLLLRYQVTCRNQEECCRCMVSRGCRRHGGGIYRRSSFEIAFDEFRCHECLTRSSGHFDDGVLIAYFFYGLYLIGSQLVGHVGS